MKQTKSHISNEHLVTPRAAAIAGILFAILFGTSYTLILRSTPEFGADTGAWLASSSGTANMCMATC
jgi:hypothetical protein